MDNIKDFPHTGKFYFTRRGKFKVLAVKGNKVTIEWQDNRDKVTIETAEMRKVLIPEAYSGDAENYKPVNDVPYRIKPKSDDPDNTEDDEEE